MKVNKKQMLQIIISIVVFVLVLGLVSCGLSKEEPIPETIEPFTTEPSIDGEIAETKPVESETIPVEDTSPSMNETEPPIQETEHVHEYEEYVFAATCTDDGVREYTCSCGDIYKEYIETSGHKYEDWIIEINATCDTEGKESRVCLICHQIEVETIEKTSHNYVSAVTKPTCTKSGFTTHTCENCGKVIKDTYVDATHDFSDWKIISKADCENIGRATRSCKVCNMQDEKVTSALGHDYEKAIVEPTCTTGGYTVFTCKRCEHEYVAENTNVIEHKFSDWQVTVAATCEVNGTQVRKCNCGTMETSVIEKLGHDLVHHNEKPATCNENGWAAYDTCTRCEYTNYKEIALIGHVFGDWYTVKEATCTENGAKARMCLNCKKLEEKDIPALGHSYDLTVVEPTCSEKGYDLHTCSRCEDSYKENYKDMVAHEMGEWEEVEPSTCIKEGKERRKCKYCEHFELVLKPFSDHDYEMVVTKPTCTESGYTTCTCIDCGDVIIINRTVPRGHTFMSWNTTVDATCSNAGQETRRCLCGEIETRTIDPLGHDEIVHDAQNATCENIGWNEYVTCTRCSYTTYEEIAKLNHSYGEWYVVKNATCTEVGEERRDCINCSETESRPIGVVGHASTAVVTEPTCTEQGYTTYTCSCGYVEVTDYTDKIPHNYKNTIVEATCKNEGYTMYECEMCGDSYKDNIIQKKDHTWSDWIVEIPATVVKAGLETRTCSFCDTIEERPIDKIPLDERIVAYYVVIDNQVVDLISGKTMENATIEGEYFRGGKVVLPATYSKYTIEMIMEYNRTSTENPINDNFAYYGGALKFQEIDNPSNWHYIKTPFGGGQIWTDFTLRPSLNYNTRVFSNGDSYWAFAVDAAGSYSVQINDNYVNKSHWASEIRKTFTLSTTHKFKEFVVYSEMLTQDELAEHFEATNIAMTAETNTLIGRVTNGITGLGSAFAFTQTGQYGIPEWYNTNVNSGSYTVNDGNGFTLNYEISDYVEPDLGIDHSKYESVHIINNPETLCVDYKYALSAVPYPFNVNHNGVADQYDVSWSSSDTDIASIIDGLIIPKKTGTVTITATLRGTTMSDSCIIKIVAKENVADKVFNVPADYVSANGNSFSNSDYTMTTNAIYDAIDEAYFAGYNHVVFPQIDFYAAPTGTTYYIPTGMTVEFPEGSAFHMMPSDIAKSDGYTYFQMGGGWWSCALPEEKSYEKTDSDGNVLAYYCKDAHLIIDKYYGEFYKADTTMAELNTGANEYAWGCVLLSMGKRAEYCSVEIREANCPTGFFITMGGKGNNEMINAAGGTIAANKFVSGWLDDTGTIVENSNWISTPDFYTVSPGAANGMDTLHEYYMGEWEHNVTTATQHLYDILWFDENKELIQVNRWQYVDEGYSNKPTGAKYFKISMQQSDLPSGTDFYIGLYPDEATKFCEVKNTNIINGADGLASVVGATEACWIHDNYVSGDGLLSGACWALDLEDGWMGMRGTIIERNIFRKYAYSSSHGEYRGPDSGILALASGYNTFVISNYLGAIAQSNYNVVNTHVINNVVHSMYSGFSGGKPNEIRTKINGHVFYNVLGQTSNTISGNGVVYYHDNQILSTINLW